MPRQTVKKHCFKLHAIRGWILYYYSKLSRGVPSWRSSKNPLYETILKHSFLFDCTQKPLRIQRDWIVYWKDVNSDVWSMWDYSNLFEDPQNQFPITFDDAFSLDGVTQNMKILQNITLSNYSTQFPFHRSYFLIVFFVVSLAEFGQKKLMSIVQRGMASPPHPLEAAEGQLSGVNYAYVMG